MFVIFNKDREATGPHSVVSLETDTNLQVLVPGNLGGGENGADAGSIDGDRLLHEHVLAEVDRVLEVHGAEAWRCRQDDKIHITVHGLGVGVKSDKAVLFGHVDALRDGV